MTSKYTKYTKKFLLVLFRIEEEEEVSTPILAQAKNGDEQYWT
jgi:hypothetical protein